jgi:mRNA interferase RelE/StbE
VTSRPRQSARKTSGAKPAETGSVRESGRHPDAERAVVRFTDAAVSDLEQMVRKGDPQVARWALKKCLLLERDPEAGEGLRGALIGFRKLTVGDRDWRVVWRVTHDDEGRPVVDVAEVWALGARSDSEVYDEMRDRVAALSKNPKTLPLAEVIERLGKVAAGLSPENAEPVKGPAASRPASEPDTAAEVPRWLVQALVKVAGMPAAEVAKLSADEAERRWLEHISAPR